MDRPTGGSCGKSVRTCVCLTRCLGLLWTPSLPSLPPILKSLPSPVMTHLHHQIHCRQEFAQPPLLDNRKCLPLWDILPLKWEAVIIRANISQIHIVSKAHTWRIFLINHHINPYGLLGEKGLVAQRGGIICPQSHSEKEEGLGFEPTSERQSWSLLDTIAMRPTEFSRFLLKFSLAS